MILHIDPQNIDPEIVARAAKVLRDGGLVAFPTETVYGLGANALDAVAVEKIFAAKQRPHFNPLIVHLPDTSRVLEVAAQWPEKAQILAEHFWPGPLTLVLPKRDIVPDRVTAGLNTVAVRVPQHPVAQALLQAAQIPVAAPSANLFMQLSPTRAQHVAQSLENRVDLILDGGPCNVGIESTVLSLADETPVLLRPGSVSRTQIEKLIGPVASPQEPKNDTPRLAPGMLERHYAPRAKLVMFEGREELKQAIYNNCGDGIWIGALLLNLDATSPEVGYGITFPVVMPHDAQEYARKLYEQLHALDELGCVAILVESVPDFPAWDGIRDRLQRAGFQEK